MITQMPDGRWCVQGGDPCGCTIEGRGHGMMDLEVEFRYCHLHLAAPDLLAAVKALVPFNEESVYYDRKIAAQAEAAIRKAEGEGTVNWYSWAAMRTLGRPPYSWGSLLL